MKGIVVSGSELISKHYQEQLHRSGHYREYKLCKLLQYPIEHYPPREFSQKMLSDVFHSGNTSADRGLTGISRQSSITEDSASTDLSSERSEEPEFVVSF